MKNLLDKIKRFCYTDRSNAWKAAVSTAVVVFFTAMLGATLNLWEAVQNWANGEDPEILDDLAVWGQALMSGAFAAVTGIINYAFRKIQQVSSKMPGSGPTYGSKAPAQAPWPPPPPPVG